MTLQSVFSTDTILTALSVTIITLEVAGRVYRRIERVIRHRRRSKRLADPNYNRERFAALRKEIE